ncbi:MAG: sodium:proton antiporter [Phycisphaerales bacterium]|nr:sodium:proton antiporter [Phycisphaerales bacterium]MCI0632071.1 sodium:proton antiporter [Phycisphaerales bacterium]MCI0675560.1 sodium:proton antiporter [Phycisphaerales bacterium]
MHEPSPVHDRNTSLRPVEWGFLIVGALAFALLILRSLIVGQHAPQPHVAPGFWGLGIVPFILILASIAMLPLIPFTRHWWESNRNRLIVALSLSLLTVLYVIASSGIESVPAVLQEALASEYLPFIILLFSLYVISGGISLTGDLPAHPLTNATFLAVGAVLANVIGTTGASMLLIRALLQTNSERTRVTHTVIFFIFLVSNVGGTLLPIGDPPLFLGYLKGVPFLWTLKLWLPWAFSVVILLAVYFVWDTLAYKRETIATIRRDEATRLPLRLRGSINFIWLAGIVLAVALLDQHKPVPGTSWTPFPFMRELIMLGLVGLSLATTPQGMRARMDFNYSPIIEVAALFLGIFITMQVPLAVLRVYGGQSGLDQPWEYFWATGSLSALLDNAPTYLVFFETANAMTRASDPGVLKLVTDGYIREDLLAAISLGAVFFGACTYIGNGPNFMVKAIAERSGVKMPGFLKYMLYSGLILLPLFVVVSMLFPL